MSVHSSHHYTVLIKRVWYFVTLTNHGQLSKPGTVLESAAGICWIWPDSDPLWFLDSGVFHIDVRGPRLWYNSYFIITIVV